MSYDLDQPLSIDALRTFLSGRLPDYMVLPVRPITTRLPLPMELIIKPCLADRFWRPKDRLSRRAQQPQGATGNFLAGPCQDNFFRLGHSLFRCRRRAHQEALGEAGAKVHLNMWRLKPRSESDKTGIPTPAIDDTDRGESSWYCSGRLRPLKAGRRPQGNVFA
jgi:hypothetical protein